MGPSRPAKVKKEKSILANHIKEQNIKLLNLLFKSHKIANILLS